MSVFAKRLKYYIENSGQTIYSVAVTSGVERTMIHRMMKGDRIPTNKNVVLAVARTLLLSPSDTDDLMTAYEISRRGESAYRQLQHVQQLLLDCVKPSLLTINPINPIHPPENLFLDLKTIISNQSAPPQIIREKPHVNQLVRTLLEMELQKNDGQVCLIAQPDYQYLYESLASMTHFAPNAKIQNIICFDRGNDDENCYNLRCLEKLLPTLLACPAFEARCYYDHVTSVFNEWTLMPCMLLTSDYVLCFSTDASQALLFDDTEMNNFMRTFFQKKLACTMPICHSLKTSFQQYMQSVLMAENSTPPGPQIFTILYQPCMTPFIDNDIILNHLNMEYFSPEMLQRMAVHFQVMKTKNTVINSCFTREGLELFLKTGRITEIPDQFYRPLDVASRKRILHNMIQAIEAGTLVPHIIDTAKFSLPKELSVEALSPTQIILYLYADGDMAFSLTLNEPSLLHAFYSFLEYIQNSRLVYSRKETLHILQQLGETYL